MLATALASLLATLFLIQFQTVRANERFPVLSLPYLPRPPLRLVDQNTSSPLVVIPPYTVVEATSFKYPQPSSGGGHTITQTQSTESISQSSSSINTQSTLLSSAKPSRTALSTSPYPTATNSTHSRTSISPPLPIRTTQSQSASTGATIVSRSSESTSLISSHHSETPTTTGLVVTTIRSPFSQSFTFVTAASGTTLASTFTSSQTYTESKTSTASNTGKSSTMSPFPVASSTTFETQSASSGSHSELTYPITYKTVTVPAITVTIEASSTGGYPISYETVTTSVELTITVPPSSSIFLSTSGQSSTDIVSVNSVAPSEVSSGLTTTHTTVSISGLNPGVQPAPTTPVPVADNHNGVVTWRPPSLVGALVALLATILAL